MVYTENERKEFIAKANKDPELRQIQWTPKHKWDEQDEKNKL